MDDPDGHILSLASDYSKVVTGLIQENACTTHALPQVPPFCQLPGRERYFFSLRIWNLTQADVTVKTSPGAEIPDSRDYPKRLLVLLGVPRGVAPGLLVRELQAIAQDHHVVRTKHTRRLLQISVGPVDQTGIPV